MTAPCIDIESIFGSKLPVPEPETLKRKLAVLETKAEEDGDKEPIVQRKKWSKLPPLLEPASYVVCNSWRLLFVDEPVPLADADAMVHFLAGKQRFRNRKTLSFGSFWKNRFAPFSVERSRKNRYEIFGELAALVAKLQQRFADLQQLECFLVEEHFFDSSAKRGGSIVNEDDKNYPETLAVVLFFLGQSRRISIKTPNSPHMFATRHNSAIVMYGTNFLDGSARQFWALNADEPVGSHSMLTLRFKLGSNFRSNEITESHV